VYVLEVAEPDSSVLEFKPDERLPRLLGLNVSKRISKTSFHLRSIANIKNWSLGSVDDKFGSKFVFHRQALNAVVRS
jgi:hypothetical protein